MTNVFCIIHAVVYLMYVLIHDMVFNLTFMGPCIVIIF